MNCAQGKIELSEKQKNKLALLVVSRFAWRGDSIPAARSHKGIINAVTIALITYFVNAIAMPNELHINVELAALPR
jgi:hypothetical protein